MAVTVTCSRCEKSFRVPDQFAGKRGRCKTCGEPFQVLAAASAGAPAVTDSYDLVEPPADAVAESPPPPVHPRASSGGASSRILPISSEANGGARWGRVLGFGAGAV